MRKFAQDPAFCRKCGWTRRPTGGAAAAEGAGGHRRDPAAVHAGGGAVGAGGGAERVLRASGGSRGGRERPGSAQQPPEEPPRAAVDDGGREAGAGGSAGDAVGGNARIAPELAERRPGGAPSDRHVGVQFDHTTTHIDGKSSRSSGPSAWPPGGSTPPAVGRGVFERHGAHRQGVPGRGHGAARHRRRAGGRRLGVHALFMALRLRGRVQEARPGAAAALPAAQRHRRTRQPHRARRVLEPVAGRPRPRRDEQGPGPLPRLLQQPAPAPLPGHEDPGRIRHDGGDGCLTPTSRRSVIPDKIQLEKTRC